MLVLKILLPVLVVLAIALGVGYVIRSAGKASQPESSLTSKKASELLHEAAKVLASLGTGRSLDEIDILTEKSRDAVNNWLSKYQKEVQ